jgi:hypothetical protein
VVGGRRVNLLAQEQRTELIRQVTDGGRRYYQAWVERVFSPLLEDVPREQRTRRPARVIAVTDVYTWKILRRDLDLSREEAEVAARELAAGILRPAEALAPPGWPGLSAPFAGPHEAPELPSLESKPWMLPRSEW